MPITIALPTDKISVGPYTFDLSKMHSNGIMYLLTFAAKQSLSDATALSAAQRENLMKKGNKWRPGLWNDKDMEEYEEHKRDARYAAIMNGTLDYNVDSPLAGGGRVDDITKALYEMAGAAIKAAHAAKPSKGRAPLPTGADWTTLVRAQAEKVRDLPFQNTSRTWHEEAARRVAEMADMALQIAL